MDILRKLLGPSKEEIWRQLCGKIDGRYIEGGFWKGDKVEATHGEWTITLDTYTVSNGKSSVTYTRMRAPYVNPDGFHFTIYRKGIFSDIAKWFGMQDVAVGYEPFDQDFIIKGNSEMKLRQLFADARIRELIAAQPAIRFTVKDDEGWFGAALPEGVDELYFEVVGVIKDVERLKMLYELFAETLDQLCHIGSAYENKPNVTA
ncbi:MAG TPA: hypothetical protein VK738_17955 [Terriglobales bacterium]|jgi:hypothetical protein|nr:hypothetical protein [Terriglobales bacterium]